MTTMKIFISHSSNDVEFATLLIDLLRKSLNLRSTDIRCSSVDGYRLPGGVSTDQSLRDEVHDAKLMIGLITPHSLKSAYVSFELGARWGADKPMIPLLASGATPKHLGGPLAGINALDCGNESQVNQFVEEASSHLKIDLDQPSSYVAEINSLVEMSSESAVAAEQQSTNTETPQLSEEAKELLTEATKDRKRRIRKFGPSASPSPITYAELKDAHGETQEFIPIRDPVIKTNGKDFGEIGTPRSEAVWEGALDELIRRELAKDADGSGEIFTVTHKGFEVADTLKGT